MALEQTAQGGSTEGTYIALRVKQLRAEQQSEIQESHKKVDSEQDAESLIRSNRFSEEVIDGSRCLSLAQGQWALCTKAGYFVYKDKPSLLESIEHVRLAQHPAGNGLIRTIYFPEYQPQANLEKIEQVRKEKLITATETIRRELHMDVLSAHVKEAQSQVTSLAIQSEDVLASPTTAIGDADEAAKRFYAGHVRNSKWTVANILFFALVGLASVVFVNYFNQPRAVNELRKLSKEELVEKLTDRKLNSWTERSTFGSKLVSSGRLNAFAATQLPSHSRSMQSQAISNSIEGSQTWWRDHNDTTLMILYNPTSVEVTGIRLNIHSGKCNAAANTEIAVIDYQLGSVLRTGDLTCSP